MMYWHNKLTKMGFKITHIELKQPINERSGIDYMFKNEKVEIYVFIQVGGKITMFYREKDSYRELEFSVNYFNEDHLLVNYIKNFIKKYR